MAKPKIDGVIEAVRYNPDGQINWVRAYLRRGPTYSDRILLDRQKLIDLLKSGKYFVSGVRLVQMASTFQLGRPVHLLLNNGQEILVTDETQRNQDHLEGVPIL
ncbi:MAG: hypothetical protein A2W35_06960 [Chloroflexi bacterium RBG_16_57_11]|nr:MAG: hypothetical protein A2W35_06960 [Chloroflexi bacterium RBG_16_57_11]